MRNSIRNLLLSGIIGLFSFYSFGQDEGDIKEFFLEAESYYLFEEYKEALPLYQRVLKAQPENYNVHFKIGVCFLYDKYKKENAIKYLEKASNHVTLNYRQNNFKEKLAPFEVHFYLADAYRVNNMLDKALERYQFFLSEMDEDTYDRKLVEQRIASMKYAREAVNDPVYFEQQNLGEKINSRFIERNAVISGDGKTLVFTRELQFYDAVFITRKVDGEWSNPINLTPEFALDGNSYSTGISYDGTELFIYRNDNYDGNIYSSRFANGRWSVLTKLNDHINTKYWESHASVSADGEKLYFTSNRKGGQGELDIYVSHKNEKGDWGPARNIGNTINTPYNEESPFLSSDGNWLYFSSQGHKNMGGYDVFRSRKMSDGSWSEPENIGYPLNTTHDDMFYCPYDNGHFGVYHMHDENGYGLDDIVMVELFSDMHPRPMEMLVTVTPDMELTRDIKEHIQITIRDYENKSIKDVSRLEEGSDQVAFNLSHGKYQMDIEGPGIEAHSQIIDIPVDHQGDTFHVQTPLLISDAIDQISKQDLSKSEPPVLEPDVDSLVVSNKDRLTITFKVDKNTGLTIKHLHDNNIIDQQEHQVNKRSFDYEVSPLPGINHIEAIAEDQEGNITRKMVTIDYQPVDTAPTEIDTIEYYTDVKDIYEFLHAKGSEPVQMAVEEMQHFEVDEFNKIFSELSSLAQQEFFTQQEIDSLFALYYAQKSVDQYLNEWQLSAKGNLARVLQTIDPDKENIQTHKQLLEYLRDDKFSSTYNDYDLLHAFSVLMTNNDTSNLNTFYQTLQSVSKGKIHDALQDISFSEENIHTPLDLLTHLYDHHEEFQFSKDELFDLLLELSTNYNVEDLYFNMVYFSDNELNQYLIEIGNELDQFNTSHELIQELLHQSAVQPYEALDVINTLKTAREDGINAGLIKQILTNNASGSLKDYIHDTRHETLRALGFNGYINQILENSAHYAYSSSDVMEMLLSLSGYDNTNAFITQYQQFAGQNLSEFIDRIHGQQFHSPSHFLQFLLEEADKQLYTRQDVIDALVKLAYLNICQVVKGEKDMPEDKPGRTTPYVLVVAGLLILLMIIFFIRKKRRDKQKSN